MKEIVKTLQTSAHSNLFYLIYPWALIKHSTANSSCVICKQDFKENKM